MANTPRPNTYSASTTILSAEVNEDLNTLYNDYNGNITNANLSASAAIVDTKLAQISTAGKVATSAIASGALTVTDLTANDVQLPEGTAPSTAAGKGAIYTKDTSGQPELFYREESNGDEVQLTSGGVLAVPGYTSATPDTDSSNESRVDNTYADTNLSITFTPGAAGMVFATWSALLEAGNDNTFFALVVDGTVVHEQSTQQGSGDSEMPGSMAWAGVLSAAEHTIKIQFKGNSSDAAATIGTVQTSRLNVSYPS